MYHRDAAVLSTALDRIYPWRERDGRFADETVSFVSFLLDVCSQTQQLTPVKGHDSALLKKCPYWSEEGS